MKTAAARKPEAQIPEDAVETATHIEVAENTFLGDLMKCVIEQVKVLPKSWQQLSEAEQSNYIHRVEEQCKSAVKQAVRIILSQQMFTVPAQVESVTFKDGVKAVLKLTAGAEGRHALADSEGRIVNLVIVEADHLISENGKPVADKDQRGLPLDGEVLQEEDMADQD